MLFSLPRTAQPGVFKANRPSGFRYFAGAAAFAANGGSRGSWLSGPFFLNEMLLVAEAFGFSARCMFLAVDFADCELYVFVVFFEPALKGGWFCSESKD